MYRYTNTRLILWQTANINEKIQLLYSSMYSDLRAVLKSEIAKASAEGKQVNSDTVYFIRRCETSLNSLSSFSKKMTPAFSLAFQTLEKAERFNVSSISSIGGYQSSGVSASGGSPYILPGLGINILNIFSKINFSEIKSLSASELKSLGISFSLDGPKQVYYDGSRIITVESNTNVKSNGDASVEYELEASYIKEKHLSSMKNITLNSRNATIKASDDGLEVGLSCPTIYDKNGVAVNTTASIVCTTGTITPIATGIKMNTSAGNYEVETTVTVENIPQKWGYEPVEIPEEYEVKEYKYTKEERWQFALEDWKNSFKEGCGYAEDIAPEVGMICLGMVVGPKISVSVFSAFGGSVSFGF